MEAVAATLPATDGPMGTMPLPLEFAKNSVFHFPLVSECRSYPIFSVTTRSYFVFSAEISMKHVKVLDLLLSLRSLLSLRHVR